MIEVICEMNAGVLDDPELFANEALAAEYMIKRLVDDQKDEDYPAVIGVESCDDRIQYARNLYDAFHEQNDAGDNDWEIRWYESEVQGEELPVADLKALIGETHLLECPACHGELRHIDDVTSMRDVVKVDDLDGENFIVTMDGAATTDWESSRNDRLECTNCCKQFAFPENVELDYV